MSADAMGIDLDVRAVGDRTCDPRRADAAALLRFTDALIGRSDALDAARDEVAQVLGIDAVAPAAGAAGNFEMMNRIVDAVGIPVPESRRAMAPELGVRSRSDPA